MTPPLRFCLIGQSVMQSPSAAMHNAALSASGIVGRYENRDVPPNALSGFVAELRAGRYRGCNVTIPYKAVMASMWTAAALSETTPTSTASSWG